jgi:hypothetical protein
VDHDVISEDVDAELASAREHEAGGTWRRWACFVLVGAIIYVSVYAASEALVYRYGEHNRFLAISMAPHETYDVVILGASHALPLGFEDMNERLEERTGARIINLGIEGGGILPARLLLEYFLARHDTDNVLYVLDSFIFYSREWNEARLKDAGLLQRAPLDPALARLLWEFPAARALLPGYLSGFHKINNPDRFEPDVLEAEGEFRQTYRPIPQIDRQRIRYLYPETVDAAMVERYLGELEALLEFLDARDIKLLAIKPPLPERVLERLSGEAGMEARLRELIEDHDMVYRNFSRLGNDEAYYYDTDHLNRQGVLNFYDTVLVDFLRPHIEADPYRFPERHARSLRRFGRDVNLANITPAQVLRLECMRRGIGRPVYYSLFGATQ